MNCPACGGHLQPGWLAIHGRFWTFVLAGFSIQQCYFQPDDGGAEEMLVPWSKSRRAHRCPSCRTVVIPGEGAEGRR